MYRLAPEAPACWAAFIFVQGQSGTRYNPPASPVQHQRHCGRNILRHPLGPLPSTLKHKIPSVRNSRTHSPLRSLLLRLLLYLLLSGLQMHHRKATWVVVTERREKETNSGTGLKDASEAWLGFSFCFLVFFCSASAKRDVQAKEIKNEEGN